MKSCDSMTWDIIGMSFLLEITTSNSENDARMFGFHAPTNFS